MPFLSLTQLNITHSSLRRLHLKHYRAKMNRYMNTAQYFILGDSSLERQGEVLLIRVENRAIILDLARTMDNLRALNCRCQDDIWNNNSLLFSKDELVEWLRNSVSEKCSIRRQQSRLIQLWIHR
ncbi:unnamed protein product [Rotaria sp. Silwood2]|nr:unnamed protein product [Rotaria sp. Silwood2]CAF2638949.1 unnamed protein product [Rotaria sp. Silwood2]CAF3074913.1 unnamed protein product [Rotaria sp. Silwood2]CAF4127619.1 unnamed protein product [Rotaria sp. Silwood2]CAF4317948.1 unnamed protein product [Rotaria sp. Silwood2]